jgi:hypothetical protein
MQDNNMFDPKKISLVEFKMTKGVVETPQDFDTTKIVGHQLDNSLLLGFNLEDKLAKADFTVDIKTDTKGENSIEAMASFHLVFIYRVENLEELAIPHEQNILEINPGLANALSSVSYSTARGILLTRLQGTAFQNFFLPIINPNSLINQ